MKELEKKIFNISLPFCEQQGVELISVEDCLENGTRIIRIIIDTPMGVTIDEATSINEAISQALDELDPIPGEYYLEVSSPGVERPLRTGEEIKQSVGKYVNIKTYEKINVGNTGLKEFEGTLLDFDGEKITILARIKQFDKQVVIPYQLVAKIRLAIKF